MKMPGKKKRKNQKKIPRLKRQIRLVKLIHLKKKKKRKEYSEAFLGKKIKTKRKITGKTILPNKEKPRYKRRGFFMIALSHRN